MPNFKFIVLIPNLCKIDKIYAQKFPKVKNKKEMKGKLFINRKIVCPSKIETQFENIACLNSHCTSKTKQNQKIVKN